MTNKSNIKLVLEDIDKFTLITQVDSSLEPTYVSYRVVGRDTTDTLRNKDLTHSSNKISARYIGAVDITNQPSAANQSLISTSTTTAAWGTIDESISPTIVISGNEASDIITLHGSFGSYNYITAGGTPEARYSISLPPYSAGLVGKRITIFLSVGSTNGIIINDPNDFLNSRYLDIGAAITYQAPTNDFSFRWTVISRKNDSVGLTRDLVNIGGGNLDMSSTGTVAIRPNGTVAIKSTNCVFIGDKAGDAYTSSTALNVIAIGASAASETTGENNVIAIGSSAARWRPGTDTIAIGTSAFANALNVTSSLGVIAIGTAAARGLTSLPGNYCIAIGTSAMRHGGGAEAIAIGYLAAGQPPGIPSARSISIGSGANSSAVAGDTAIGIGQSVSSSGLRSIVLGGLSVASGNDATVIGYSSTAVNVRDIILGRAVTTTANAVGSVIVQSNSSIITYPPACVVIGLTNVLPNAGAQTNIVCIGKSNNIANVVGSLDITTIGRSNTISNAALTTATTLLGDLNSVSSGATNLAVGRSCSIGVSTSNGVAVGTGCSVNTAGVNTFKIVAVGAGASASSPGATSFGVDCTSVESFSVALGFGSRAIGATMNCGVPSSIRVFTSGDTQANAHRLFSSSTTSLSTVLLTISGATINYDFAISSGLLFMPTRVIACNYNSIGSGSVTFSVGVVSDATRYRASSLTLLGASSFNTDNITASNIAGATNANTLRVQVTSCVQTVSAFRARIIIEGYFMQTI